MISSPLSLSRLSCELALELVDDSTKLFEVYAFIASPKLANRRFQIREEVCPLPPT